MVIVPQFVKTFFTHILTGVDGQTFDIARVTWFISSLFYLGMTVYVVVYKGAEFNYVNWSIGLSSIMAAAGASIKLKENTEPKREQQ